MGAFNDDVEKLQQATDSIAWSNATLQARKFSDELRHYHDSIYAALGVPSEMFHPAYVPARAHGSIAIKKCTMDLHTIQAQIMKWGPIVFDEYSLCEPSMVNGFMEPTFKGTQPGYTLACGRCAYAFRCMRATYPQVCKCCRASNRAPLFMEVYSHETLRSRRIKSQAAFEQELTNLQAQFCRLQTERERVPTACTLFVQSTIVCPACTDKTVPRTYRVWVQEPNHRRNIRLMTLSQPRSELRPPTFREHLERFTSKRHSHANTIPQQRQCAQRRPGCSNRKRQAK